MYRILLSIILLSLTLTAYSRQISSDEAEAIASGFLNSSSLRLTSPIHEGVSRVKGRIDNDNSFQPYYVFNADDCNGFVIVSGDDRHKSILGYSDKGAFSFGNIPPQLKVMLDSYEKNISSVSALHCPVPSRNTNNFNNQEIESIVLSTASWGQDQPYNLALNKIDGELPVSGCVATAMSIIMKYHGYPDKGRKSHAYFDSEAMDTREMDFSQQTFEWNDMLDWYKPGEYSKINADAVSQLMRCAGISVGTTYGVNESGASITTVASAFQRHFNYSPNIHEEAREGFDDFEWFDYVKHDIEADCPVLYYGSGTGSHAFVIDGYSSDGACHINWGWDGNANGFFYLDELTPADYDFSADQGAVFGISPSVPGDEMWSECFLADSRYFPDLVDVKDFNVSVNKIEVGVPFDVSTATIAYPYGFGGSVGIALVNKEYKVKEILFQRSILDNFFEHSVLGAYGSFMGCMVNSSNIEPGDKLSIVTQEWGESEWKLVKTRNRLAASCPCDDLNGKFMNIKWNIDPRITVVIGDVDGRICHQWSPEEHDKINTRFLEGLYLGIWGQGMNESRGEASAIRVDGETIDVSAGTYPTGIWMSLSEGETVIDILAHSLDQDSSRSFHCEVAGGIKNYFTDDLASNCHVTDIKISGDLNSDDLLYIRNNMMFVRNLNLEKCEIRASGSNEEKKIPDGMFYGLTRIEDLKLPENIVKIGNYAFQHSSIKYLTLPSSVKEIGTCAFYTLNEPLRAVFAKSAQPPVCYGCFVTPEKSYLYVLPGCHDAYEDSGDWSCFKEVIEADNPLMEQVVVRIDGLNYELIHDHAEVVGFILDECPENLIIQDKIEYGGKFYPVTSIRYRALLYNTAIKSVIVPESIVDIDYSAFSCCYNLEEIVLNARITNLHSGVFEGNYRLKRIKLPDTLEVIESGAISSIDSLEKINIPKNVYEIDRSSISAGGDMVIELDSSNPHFTLYNGGLYTINMDRAILIPHGDKNKKITIPEGVKYLNWGLFCNYPEYGEISLPTTCVELSLDGFLSTGGFMEHFEIPDNVTGIYRASIPLAENITIGKKVGAPYEDNNIIHGELDNAFAILNGEYDRHVSVFLKNYSNIPIHRMLASIQYPDINVDMYSPYLFPNFSFIQEPTLCKVNFYIPGGTLHNLTSDLRKVSKEMWFYNIDRDVKYVRISPIIDNIKIEKVLINGIEVKSPNEMYHYDSDISELEVEIIYRLNDYITLTTKYDGEFNMTLPDSKLINEIVITPEEWHGYPGDFFQINATVFPEDASCKSLLWTTNDDSVATVDSYGNVVARKTGETFIITKALDGSNVSAICHVTVLPIPVKGITLCQESADLKVGDVLQLIASVYPENATDKTVVWTSDNAAVATVDANGNVTAVALGTATITASCGDATAACVVTVVATPAESVTVSQTTAELKVGGSVSLSSEVLPIEATDRTVVWTSDNESVATVDGNGTVTAVSLGIATITASCGNVSASCTVTVVATPVESIVLSQTEAELKVGESVALTATVLPEDATDKTVVWTCDNEAVATVDSNGNVTAVSLGTATITANCGNVSASCAVTVSAREVESVIISNTEVELKVGGIFNLTADVYPEDAIDKTVTWSSDNDAVATVDADGTVTAISLGTATITASCGNYTASCDVTVVATPAESVSIGQTVAELKVGESVALTATVYPEDATDKIVTWTSDNSAVASVDENGNVIALAIGTAKIIASCGNVSATCVVSVIATLVEDITLTPDSWNGIEGETFKIEAAVMPENATDKTLEWASSDESVATVDGEGNVTVLKEGTCVIKATATDGSGVFAECIITSVSGVESIFSAEDNVDVYGLNGILIKKNANHEGVKLLTPGIYLIRQGSEMKKLVIR